jgi:hypothetical protein
MALLEGLVSVVGCPAVTGEVAFDPERLARPGTTRTL